MVFHRRLSDSKSPQISRIHLSILAIFNNTVVWMVSTRPPTFKSSKPFNNSLVTVPKAPITIGIIITFMFYSFFNSLARSKYLSLFSHSSSYHYYIIALSQILSTLQAIPHLVCPKPRKWYNDNPTVGIGLHYNAHKTEYMCYNQTGNIATLDGASLKLVDKFTYLGSSVSSNEKDIDTRLTKAWTAIDRLSIIWKSDLTDKMKRSFFQAAVVSILLYGCTTWTLTKRPEKKTRRKLHWNVESSIEQVLATTPHETPTIRTLAPHHENYTS